MVFERDSDQNDINNLREQVEDIIDNQIFGVGDGELTVSNGTMGRRNSASGVDQGLRGNNIRIHQLTEKDESGTPTGTFNRINFVSSLIIVDHTSTPMVLKFINGKPVLGTSIKITAKVGKTLTIETGGDFQIASNIDVDDSQILDFVFFSELETGVTGGAFRQEGVSGGGTGNVPDPTAEFQHLQSDAANNWIAQQEFEFGLNSADAGQIRIPNDTIGLAWRNVANDGNIEIKTTSTDILDITNSANDTVVLSLRAQDGTFSDISSSWSQLPNVGDLGGSTILTYPTEFVFNHGATLVALFDENDEVNFFGDVDVNESDIIKVDRFQISGGTPSATSVNDVVWYLDSNDNLVSNVNATDGWIWTSGNIIKMILTDDTLQKQNVTAPNFELYNTRTAQTGTAGIISILANSSDISTGIPMGFLIADTEAIAGDGRGSLKLGVNLDGTPTLFLTINEGNDEQLDILKETDFNAQDVLGINRLQIVGGTPSATSVNDVVWYLDADGNLVSNVNATDGWIWSSGNVVKMILTDSTLEKRNVTAPSFQLYNTQAAQVGTAGSINILANSANFPTGTTMGFILADTEVITGDGSGSMKLGVNLNGILTSFIEINDSNDGNVKLLTNLDLDANFMQLTEIALPSNPAADNGLIYLRDVAGITTPLFLDSAGTETSMIASGGVSNVISQLDSNVTVTDSGSNGVINFVTDGISLGNMSDALGWIIDNSELTISSATGKINFQNGFEIVNTSSNTTTFAIPNNEFLLIAESGAVRVLIGDDILFSCDNAADILFQEGGVTVGRYDGSANEWQFDQAVRFNGDVNGDIIGTSSNILGSLAIPWAALDANRVNLVTGGVAAGIFLVDADGIEINAVLTGDFIELKTQGIVRANFKSETDGGITFFEPLEVNDNIRIDGGNMIHAHDGIECGFAVTEDITSPGTFGTLQGPVNPGNATNAAAADSDFGAAIGCKGLYLNNGGTPLRVEKMLLSPSTWAIELLVASGNIVGGRLT